MKAIHTKQAKVHFAHFVQYVIIVKFLTSCKVLFKCDSFVAAAIVAA